MRLCQQKEAAMMIFPREVAFMVSLNKLLIRCSSEKCRSTQVVFEAADLAWIGSRLTTKLRVVLKRFVSDVRNRKSSDST